MLISVGGHGGGADGGVDGNIMTAAQTRLRTAANPLPACLIGELRARFDTREVAYIAAVLTADELAVVSDLSDALIIARIKRMPARRLKRFDELVPAGEEQLRLYHAIQLRWLREEEYLLSTRLGRQPTPRELFVDFMNNHNGQRFRAYFALKYPQGMKPKRTPAASR